MTVCPPRSALPIKWLAAGALAAAVLAALVLLPVPEYLESLLEWTREIGPWGYLVLIGLYIVATVLFVPGMFLTLAGGFLFGVVGGSIAISIGSTLGAGAAFLVGRFVARENVERLVRGNARFAAVDHAVGVQGFKIVFLIRLSPIFPFNVLNYAFGLTRVRFWQYLIGSWLGMLPATVMYVYLGSTAGDLAKIFSGGIESGGSGDSGGAGPLAMKLIGLAATVAVTVYVTRIARRALREAVAEDGPGEGESGPGGESK